MRLRRLALPLLACAALFAQPQTALDRYVAAKDSVYGWKLVKTIPGEGVRTDVLELTSQTWRTEKDVDRPVWKHWLSITRPDKVASSTALLFIGGGKNGDPAPSKSNPRSVRIATETNSVVADLGMVPNQPLFFTDSPDQGRSEDNIIAYSRVKHFTTKDDNWLVRLAMVKSGVRAMDAIQEFLATEAGGKVKIDHFVVAGGSKRGWTTWLVGAVDKRVVAIMPMVIDALNSEAITKHHFEAYGFFSTALNDYVRHGLFPAKIGTPEYKAVLDIEDPYNYRDRPQMKMPKFLINASGDQYFLPDNSQLLLLRPPGGKTSPLRPERQAQPGRQATPATACWPSTRRFVTRHSASAFYLEDGERLHRRERPGQARRSQPVASHQPRRARLPRGYHRQSVHSHPNSPKRKRVCTSRKSRSRPRASPPSTSN